MEEEKCVDVKAAVGSWKLEIGGLLIRSRYALWNSEL